MSALADMKITALAPWFGGKRTLAPVIVQEMGRHSSYWDLMCGSLAVPFAKPKSREETINDLHGDAVNLARVLASDQWWEVCDRIERTVFCESLFEDSAGRLGEDRGDEIQRAYDYLAVSWMGLNGVAGTSKTNANFCVRYTSNGGDPAKRWRSVGESLPIWHERLLGMRILRRDAFILLERIEDKDGTVIYIDPPYVKKSHSYLFDFDKSDDPVKKHRQLAALASRFKKTRVVISYYDDPLVDELYTGWTKRLLIATKGLVSSGMRGEEGATKAPEILIINGPSLARAA